MSRHYQSIMFDQQITIEGHFAKAYSSRPDEEISAVDMAALLSFEELQEDGEPDLVVELIGLYLQDAPVKIEAIQEAAAKVDGASLKRAAHSLKGSSGTLGVRQVATVCEALERLAADALTFDATALAQRLQKEFIRAQAVLVSELRLRSPAV